MAPTYSVPVEYALTAGQVSVHYFAGLPGPASATLLGLGLLALARRRRRRA